MREPTANYAATQYERPNQPWVCGLTEAGHACSAGPTARGRCPALAECAPIRDGDRWICNRTPLRGGSCDIGPTPDGDCGCVHVCQPVRSLRAKRGRFILACSLAVIGGMIVVLNANWRDRIIRPGPLAPQHAQLLERANSGSPNCRACHAAASENIAGWTTSLVVSHSDQPTQPQLCMNCHAKSIPAATAVSPHNVSPDLLRRATQSGAPVATGVTTIVNSSPSEHSPSHEIACAACHREHHGAQISLTAMDNVACQTCHQQRYQSFATDHPDFGSWPYERRTQIAFDHASHMGKHFPEKKQAFDCRSCHVSEAAGTVEKTVSYEKACAGCHDEKIATSIARGVPILALPTLDVDVLKKAGHDIGAWPKGATGDFDGHLPPPMKLMLAGDPATAKAIEKLGAGFEFQDVDSSNQEQIAAIATIAEGIKSLISDVSTRGSSAVRERLARSLGREVTEAETASLTAGLSIDTTRDAARWLGLTAPAAATASESPVAKLARSDSPFGPAGVWTHDDATFAVRYRPTVHADPILASWLELLTRTPQVESKPIAAAVLKELSKATAPGLCASCHSVEQSDVGTLTINWSAFDRSTKPRGFTKFSHGPHLVLPQLENCTSCHTINTVASTAASYTSLNPQQFVSDFKPLEKQQCASCHTKAAAGDACQSCHNYHVEAVEGWRLTTPISNKEREAERPFRISDFGVDARR